jgi:DhnA family fructose-bisphosphate aldolase class Ia
MKISRAVKKILDGYESDNPGTKGNLARILMHGKLGGTGRMVILPVDQGFEHGPARSFAPNPDAYDPHYHFQLAIDAGLNAYAAPLGMLEAGADSFAGAIPTILKLNSSNSLATNKDQAVTASVGDALRLGCAAIGFTIYPGAEDQFEMMEEIRELAEEAKAVIGSLDKRVAHVMQATFNGRRIVVFSGGEAKDVEGIFSEVRGIRDGGGNGSIIGRNTFQRPRAEALDMLGKIIAIYQEKA